MPTSLRTAALLAVVGALAVAGATPVAAAPAAATTWSPDLAAGERAGIAVDGAGARLDPAGAHLAPAEPGPPGGAEAAAVVPTGLLTLPARAVDEPSDRVGTAVDGDLPAGASAVVDVRGLRADGRWTEWIPAGDGAAVTLPGPVTRVQPRLVLAGASATDARVRTVSLTAYPATGTSLTEGGAESLPLAYRVFATREGLVGGTTANGHVIRERDHFVALPSRRALSPRGTSDYAVRVCAPNGRCAFAPVWDVGPWNTRDDYWNPSHIRQSWGDLPQGVPQAQAAFDGDYNGGRDQFDREVLNPAGIDLGDGLFWDALGLKDNSWVTVDYLWTGSLRLSKVVTDEPVEVRALPDVAADVVGLAADRAAVPVQCVLGSGEGRWLQVGEGQFLPAVAVPDTGPVDACEEPAARAGEPDTGADPSAPAGGAATSEQRAPSDVRTPQA